MGFSRQLIASLSQYIAKNKLLGKKRYPMTLMLEPSFRCNLACEGCGRIREYHDVLGESLSVEECLASVEEAGTPVVSITGGEPLLYPGIDELVSELVARRKFVHLCTNGLLLEGALSRFKPGPYLSFVVHLDGLAETHDRFANRSGVFNTAIAAVRAAKSAGFSVLTNTTIYKSTDLREIQQLFRLLSAVPTNGIMMTPAFGYEAVDSDVFLDRASAVVAFRRISEVGASFRFYNTPLYREFLEGKRVLSCFPWSTPTRNPKGWKQPCYLITDGHCSSFGELMEVTRWEAYGPGNDPRCENCMVHCGFEASAVAEIPKSLSGLWQTVTWSIGGS